MYRYLELKSELERASGVEILDNGDGYLELRLTTHVPAVRAVRADFEEIYEHKLTVKLNAITMAIETAQVLSTWKLLFHYKHGVMSLWSMYFKSKIIRSIGHGTLIQST